MSPQPRRVIVENGFPIMLAEPKHEKAPPSSENIPDLVTPDGTSGPAEWGRYHDAVREAARTFDHPQHGDIEHFLKARARNPEHVDVGAFHEAVKRQRMADLVDIVDHHMRRDGSLPRGSRMVRTQAPRGYMRRTLKKSDHEEIAHLHHRLTAIGHDPNHVSEYLKARVPGDIWDQASVTEVAFSDGEFSGLNFDDSLGDDDLELVEAIGEALSRMPAPIINVFVDKQQEN